LKKIGLAFITHANLAQRLPQQHLKSLVLLIHLRKKYCQHPRVPHHHPLTTPHLVPPGPKATSPWADCSPTLAALTPGGPAQPAVGGPLSVGRQRNRFACVMKARPNFSIYLFIYLTSTEQSHTSTGVADHHTGIPAGTAAAQRLTWPHGHLRLIAGHTDTSTGSGTATAALQYLCQPGIQVRGASSSSREGRHSQSARAICCDFIVHGRGISAA